MPIAVLHPGGDQQVRVPDQAEPTRRAFTTSGALTITPRFTADGLAVRAWNIFSDRAEELEWTLDNLAGPARVVRRLQVPTDHELAAAFPTLAEHQRSYKWSQVASSYDMAETTDSEVLLLGTEQSEIWCLSARDPARIHTLRQRGTNLAASPDGLYLAVWHNGSDNRVSVYRAEDLTLVTEWSTPYPTWASRLWWLDGQRLVATHPRARTEHILFDLENPGSTTVNGLTITDIEGAIVGSISEHHLSLGDRAWHLHMPRRNTWGITRPRLSQNGQVLIAPLAAGGVLVVDCEEGRVLHPESVRIEPPASIDSPATENADDDF